MTAQLSSAEQTRLTRAGLVPISHRPRPGPVRRRPVQQQPYLIASPFNASALARQARQHTLPAILSGLTRARPQAADRRPRHAGRAAGRSNPRATTAPP